METLRSVLTPEERQTNVDALIHRWKTNKRKANDQAIKAYKTDPRIQSIINTLSPQK